MISLQVCIANTESDTYFLKNQDRLIALEAQPSVRHLLRNDKHIVGIEEHYQLIQTYRANAVRCDNNQFVYIVEPYRLQLENDVFDERGYIINQGKMESIPFGWFNTRDKGCGWIAAYNLLKLNGKTKLMKDVLDGLKRFAFIGNLLGQEKISLYFWLKKQGLNIHMSAGTNTKIIKKMCASKSGILLYIHRHNAHYVAYEVCKDGRIHLYNAVYGKRNHIMTASEFLSEHSFIPLSSLIYID